MPQQREKQLHLLRQRAKDAKDRLKSRHAALQAAEAAYIHADTEFDRITASLHRGKGDTEAAAVEARRQQAALGALAQRRAASESKAAQRIDRHQRAQAHDIMAATGAVSQEAQRRLGAAQAGRRRLAGSSAAQEQAATAQYVNQQAEHIQKEVQERRLGAIMSLKHNTEQAHASLAAEREAAAAKAQQRDSAHTQRFDALLSAGQNPYLVFREEAMDAQFQRQAREHSAAVAARQLEVAQRVTQADMHMRRTRAVGSGVAAFAQSASVAEQHAQKAAATSRYLQSRTRGGGDVIDEGGRGKEWQPSQMAAVKTAAFGMGTMHSQDPQLLQRIASKPENQAVQPQERWVPQVAVHPDEHVAAGAGGEAGAKETEQYSSIAARNILHQRALSRLEARLQEEARQRQRDGVTQQQVVMGKAFKGAGFVPSPAQLHFKDFEVGKSMRLVLTLTNASLSFNTFRLEALADDVVDFFDVSYTRPGRMSAGTSCKLAIKFTPRVDKDIFASLDVLAQTGRISIPLQCSTRKALPVLDTPIVDLGDVTVGDSSFAVLKLHNDGFIPTDVRLARADAGDVLGADLSTSGFQYTSSAHLGSYGRAEVKFSFTAHAGHTRADRDACVGVRSMLVDVHFPSAPHLNAQALVKVNVVPEPLILENEVTEVGVCPCGKTYRCDVVAVNRGLVSLKSVLRLPQSLVAAGIVESQPTLAYVQATPASGESGSFGYSVVFCPPEALAAWQQPALRRFVVQGQGQAAAQGTAALSVSIPFEIKAPDQTLPVYGSITATLTPGAIEVVSSELSFGDLAVGLAQSQELRLHNPSALPVQVGVVKSPSCLTFGSTGGVFVLLPGETATIPVVCSPADERPVHGSIQLCSTLGDMHSLPVHVFPHVPSLQMSSSLITFPSLSAEQTTSCVVYVRNTSHVPQDVQLLSPPAASGFSVAPHHKSALQSGEQLAVQVEFSPAMLDAHAGALQRAGDEAGGGAADASLLRRGTFQLKGGVHIMPAGFMDTHDAGDAQFATAFVLACAKPSDSPTHQDPQVAAGAMLQATVLPQMLSLSDQSLDFGTVAVASKTTLYVSVQNHRSTPIGLVVQGQDGSGAFQLASVPPTVSANSQTRIAVQFCPKSHQVCVSEFRFRAAEGGAPCCLRLRGVGHSPQLRCSPADGRVQFGHVLTNTHHRQFLTVTNESHFPVKFNFNQQVQGNRDFFGAGMRFTVEPERGELQAGQGMRFAVGFFTEEPTLRSVSTTFTLAVVDQPQANLQFQASACAWKSPVFAFSGDEPMVSSSRTFEPAHVECQAWPDHQTSFSVGCVDRSFEVSADFGTAAANTKAQAHISLPEDSAGIVVDEAMVSLQGGDVRPVWLKAKTPGMSGATAQQDGSVQLKQSVVVRGFVKLSLLNCAALPTGVSSQSETIVPVNILSTALL